MNHEPARRGLTWGEWILTFLAILAFAGSPLSANANPPQAGRLLDLASSGGYSRKDWNELGRELNAIPVSEIPGVANAALASGRRLSVIGTVLDALSYRWALNQPEAALAFGDSITEKSLRASWGRAAFRGWAEEDWKSARAWLDKLPSGNERDREVNELMQIVAVHDPHAALQILADEFSQGRRPDTWHIMAICATRDPAAAVKAWEALPPCPQKNSGRGSLARYWAEDQPEAAWKWASGLPLAHERIRTQKDAITGAASVDPAKAACMAEQSQEPLRGELLTQVAWAWAEKDADAAAQWAGTLPTEAQAGVFVSIFNRSKITSPRALLEPMLSLPSGRDRNLAVARVLQQWSNENFSAARDWLSKQPQGPDSGLFLTSLTLLLADKDPELLLSLFDKMPDGDEKRS